MAGFKTHITTSTVLGIGLGTTASVVYGVPLPSCMLAAGLCSVGGMLPDIDSGPGVPLRESMAFAAAVVPMMMVNRFQAMLWSIDTIILVGGLMYLTIRFGFAAFLRRHTVHRGMFHSFPACLIAGELTFLILATGGIEMRYFMAAATMAGFMSHLILDEIWSVEVYHGRLRLKSSSGTAMKFWGDCTWSNLLTYGAMASITFLVVNDPEWVPIDEFGMHGTPIAQSAPATPGQGAPTQSGTVTPQPQSGAVGAAQRLLNQFRK